ncbi:MAG TPA: hypothetical protein VLO13_10520 [Halomonas sp.]|nr:hypothetical protein [Halomonas sp.]
MKPARLFAGFPDLGIAIMLWPPWVDGDLPTVLVVPAILGIELDPHCLIASLHHCLTSLQVLFTVDLASKSFTQRGRYYASAPHTGETFTADWSKLVIMVNNTRLSLNSPIVKKRYAELAINDKGRLS